MHPEAQLIFDRFHVQRLVQDAVDSMGPTFPARTVQACRRHDPKLREGILAYVTSGLSNGRTEGLNGGTRAITRRAYGFHSAHGLIALIKLCCSGIYLDPVHLQPGSTH
jgi:transposase